MNAKTPQTQSGPGSIIALLAITGAIAGGLAGQPTMGLLAGIGIGSAIGLLMWFRARSK